MRVPRSLRFRLLAGAAIWIVLALAAAGIGLSSLFRDHVVARFETELQHHLDQIAANVDLDGAGQVILRVPLSDPRFQRPLSGLYWQVQRDGRPVLRSRSLWDVVLTLPPNEDRGLHRHGVLGPDGQHLVVLERSVTLEDRGVDLRLAVAADKAEIGTVVRAFDMTLAGSLGLLALALIIAALVQVQVGLQPLSRLRRALASVRAGRRARIEGAMPVEVQPLVDDLNALIAHAGEVVARSRLEAGNLAHALKTNLAVLANEADGIEGGHGAVLRRQIDLIRRTIDHQMARARVAATHGVPGSTTRVGEAVAAMMRAMSRIHGERAVEIEADVVPGLVFAGDRQDFDEILGNLLDNACKWAKRRVLVSARAEGAGLRLVIDDDGPGLSAAERAAVAAPGVRLDESVPGSGLGLAMVRELAGLYGGALDLEAAPLGGLRAAVALPAAPQSSS
ncbi:MAG: sensor histidine kinase [Zavarzinia sp.]|nr:sensor histidine kinase [Zavarzinia sp.]